MKRFWAAAVDFILSFMLSMVLFCIIISGWKSLRVWMGVDWHNNVRLSVIVLLFLISFFLVSFLYSICFDYWFKGRTVGKKITGYDISPDTRSFQWMIKHALLRAAASLLYVITALYYLVTNRMIYDKMIRNYKK